MASPHTHVPYPHSVHTHAHTPSGDKYLKHVFELLLASGADASETNLNAAGKPPVLKEDKTKGCVVM
jgi:hypothetical protein